MVIASELRALAASLMPRASSAPARATHSKRHLLFLLLIFFYFSSNIQNLMRTNFFRASLMKNTTIRGVYIHIHVSHFYISLYWEENERKKFFVLPFFQQNLLFLRFHKRTKSYNIMWESYRVVHYTLCVYSIADVTQFSSSPKSPPEPSLSSVASATSCYHRM